MNKVLIVVDMQNDFVDGVLGTPEAVNIVNNVVDKINNYNTWHHRVYATKDTHSEKYLHTPEGIMLPVQHCVVGTEGWKMEEKVTSALCQCLAYSRVYQKQTFGCSELIQDLLDEHAYAPFDQIELVGLCTDICVLTNAIMLKQTFAKEFVDIIVDASCCAGSTPEKHKAALDVMKSCQIQIINED